MVAWGAQRRERKVGDRVVKSGRTPAVHGMARRLLRACTLCFSTLVFASCLSGVDAQMKPGEATRDAFHAKIRAAFDSKPSGGGTSAADSVASAVVTTSSSGLNKQAAEQHGNTRHVMESSDTPPPPIVAVAAAPAPALVAVSAAAGASAGAAETQDREVRVSAKTSNPANPEDSVKPKDMQTGPISGQQCPCLASMPCRRPACCVVCVRCRPALLA